MITEWMMILVLLWCVGLFAAGGTHIDGIGGQKWLRRYLMPAGLGGLALLYAPWWASLGYTATILTFLCMGYGSKASWIYRSIIFTGCGISSLWFGWSWWVVVTPVACSLLFLGSNTKGTASSFVWKLCESGMGFLIGAAYIGSLINKW